jgi:uncharacterized protein YjbI with pentapeptide repeats
MDIKSVSDVVLFASSLLTIKEALVEAVSKRADLRGADLRGANLYGADLRAANLRGADLYGADLYGADLRGADLYGANLRGADLRGANLRAANLRGADLYGAKHAETAIAQMQFIPETGAFDAWKKCRDGVIVKLLIPDDAKRSHGSERKCRASKAVVLDIIGATEALSLHDSSFKYRKGDVVTPHSWSEDRWETCAPGIHFYITRVEAENHQ